MCVLVTKVIGCKKRSAAVGKNALACGRERCGNRHQPWNKAPRTSLRFPMVLVFLLWMSLVLGGAAGGLWLVEALRGNWLRLARVRAPLRRPVWRSDWGVPYPSIEGSRFLYRQRQLVARAGWRPVFLLTHPAIWFLSHRFGCLGPYRLRPQRQGNALRANVTAKMTRSDTAFCQLVRFYGSILILGAHLPLIRE